MGGGETEEEVGGGMRCGLGRKAVGRSVRKEVEEERRARGGRWDRVFGLEREGGVVKVGGRSILLVGVGGSGFLGGFVFPTR